VSKTGRFAVNILGLDQIELAKLFATPRDDKFAGLDLSYGPLGDPLIPGAIAHVECETVEVATGGTHTVFLAEVRSAERFEGEPLLYYRGQLGWETMGRA
jgi:flavin reductase (DIM6/NTAB) family NADH-FMN oxidoreductase RutF